MYDRGAIVVAADPFGNTPRRPYLVVSDENHPFAGEQYIAVGISTKSYEESIQLAGTYVDGSLDRDSYLAPWAVVSLRAHAIERAVARVERSILEHAAERVAAFVGYDG